MYYIPLLFGLSTFCGILYTVTRRHAYRWLEIAREYAAEPLPEAIEQRRLQSVILFGGRLGFASYKNSVNIGVNDDGVSVRIFVPFAPFHPPLFIPFEDMEVRQSTWYWNTDTYAIYLSRVPGIHLLVDEALMKWIATRAPAIMPYGDYSELFEVESDALATGTSEHSLREN